MTTCKMHGAGRKKIQGDVTEFLKGASHPSPSYVSGIMYMVGFYSGNIQKAQQGAFHREVLRVCQHFREINDIVEKNVSCGIVFLNFERDEVFV